LAISDEDICVYDTSFVHGAEIAVVALIVAALIISGASPDSIAVVSVNRMTAYQLKSAIEEHLRTASQYFPDQIDDTFISTSLLECHAANDLRPNVDYQLREITIMVLFIQNVEQVDYTLLRCLSCSRWKIILIGDKETFAAHPIFNSILAQLPPGNCTMIPAAVAQVDTKPFVSMTKIITETQSFSVVALEEKLGDRVSVFDTGQV
jgi:hypothetical protein